MTQKARKIMSSTYPVKNTNIDINWLFFGLLSQFSQSNPTLSPCVSVWLGLSAERQQKHNSLRLMKTASFLFFLHSCNSCYAAVLAVINHRMQTIKHTWVKERRSFSLMKEEKLLLECWRRLKSWTDALVILWFFDIYHGNVIISVFFCFFVFFIGFLTLLSFYILQSQWTVVQKSELKN